VAVLWTQTIDQAQITHGFTVTNDIIGEKLAHWRAWISVE
jgi:hypothetical protein